MRNQLNLSLAQKLEKHREQKQRRGLFNLSSTQTTTSIVPYLTESPVRPKQRKLAHCSQFMSQLLNVTSPPSIQPENKQRSQRGKGTKLKLVHHLYPQMGLDHGIETPRAGIFHDSKSSIVSTVRIKQEANSQPPRKDTPQLSRANSDLGFLLGPPDQQLKS